MKAMTSAETHRKVRQAEAAHLAARKAHADSTNRNRQGRSGAASNPAFESSR